MSGKKKPKEFWIQDRCLHYEADTEKILDDDIHVIEYSAYEQLKAIACELKEALTKSKDTLQELDSDFGNFIYEDGSEETEQEVKNTYNHVEKTLTKAELTMKGLI